MGTPMPKRGFRKGTLRAVAKAKIPEMIGSGMRADAIMKELKISKDTYYLACQEIRNRFKEKDVAAEKALKVVSASEEILQMALADYAAMRRLATGVDGGLDPAKYKGLTQQIRTLREVKDSLEKTYARFGMIPSERHKVEVTSSDVDTVLSDDERRALAERLING